MNNQFWFVAVVALGVRASGGVVVVDFSGGVRSVSGVPQVTAPVGSRVAGTIEVDLSTLPESEIQSAPVVTHSYLARPPGFRFSFSVGQQTVSYDSVNASQEGGFTPSVGLQHGPGLPDILTFVLREQGNPYRMLLGLNDYGSPGSLLSGTRFPEDIHLPLSEWGVATFHYAHDDGSAVLDVAVDRVTISVIPEPNPLALMVLGTICCIRALRGAPTGSGAGIQRTA